MRRSVCLSLAILCVAPSVAKVLAAAPFAETHYHQYQSGAELGLFEAMSTTFVDIPGTTKTVTVPAGEAVIQWTVGGTNTNFALVRPVIGAHVPASNPVFHEGTGIPGNLSGSWSTTVEAGTIEVKLQAALSAEFPGMSAFNCQPDYGTGWTLAVMPTAAENVPALSDVSLAVLAVCLLGGGGLVLSSRGRRGADRPA